MKPISKTAFIIVVVLQVALLGAMITKRVHLLATGQKILLKCQPVDPRSLFSGDYVILNYMISRIEQDEIKNLDEDKNAGEENKEIFKDNSTVYLALEKEKKGKFWKALAISGDMGKIKKLYPSAIALRATVESAYSGYNLRYGVENYFVPQNEGKKIEDSLRDRETEVYIEAAVAASGESGINKLFINGKEVVFY